MASTEDSDQSVALARSRAASIATESPAGMAEALDHVGAQSPEHLPAPIDLDAMEARIAAPVAPEPSSYSSIDLRVLYASSPRPARFVRVSLEDQEGTVFSMMTDRDGRIQSDTQLAMGPVDVTAFRRYISVDSLLQQTSLSVDKLTAVGSLVDFRPEPSVPFVIDVDLPELVSLRVTAVDAEGRALDLSAAELAACSFSFSSSNAKSERHSSPVVHARDMLTQIPDEALEGLTHFVKSQDLEGLDTLEATSLHGDIVLHALVSVRDLPDLGDVPLEVPLTPSSLELQESGLSLNAIAHARQAMIHARPKRKLKVVVRSQSGPMEGMVSVRASPIGRQPEGEPAYSKRWIEVAWRINADGAVVADVVLDELDATDYSIRAVPGSGVSVIDPVLEVDLSAAEHEPIEFLAHE